MVSLHEKLAGAFKKAKRLNEELWDGPEAGRVSVERLQRIVERVYSVEIEKFLVTFPGEHVRGMIEVYQGGRRARIYIRDDQDVWWQRFVTIKELCHVVIDRKEDWSAHGCDTLERLVLGEILELELEAPENNGVRSEALAEFVAHELVYPHEFRRRDLEAIRHGATTRRQLAERYEIPEEIVERLLTRSYLSICDYYWRLVTMPPGD